MQFSSCAGSTIEFRAGPGAAGNRLTKGVLGTEKGQGKDRGVRDVCFL